MNESMSTSGDKIVVIGLGYVGCVTAACLAHLGHSVVGVDPDPHKVDAIGQSRSPFYEPGLDEIVREAVAAGRLSATLELKSALEKSSVALICVGTPSGPDGNLSVTQLQHVAREIRQLVEGRKEPLVVAVRSTVFPATCDMLAGLMGHTDRVSVV